MRYLAVLGRQPEISIAELEAVLGESCPDTFSSDTLKAVRPSLQSSEKVSRPPAQIIDIDRLGGTLKLAVELGAKPLEYLQSLPEGKITIGVSDYSGGASKKTAASEALKLKKILVRQGRSVRVVENHEAVLSTATSLHNGLNGKNERKVELIKTDRGWYRVIGVQDIDAYARRDQARPARDAKVGMLPPKLAQILINLCGPLEPGAVVLDPFCGTGVVLQEALLMGYRAYGTDISERMVKYSEKNLQWLVKSENTSLRTRVASLQRPKGLSRPLGQAHSPQESIFQISQGDATSFQWTQPIDAVACEGYLGKPFSKVPSEMELREQKQECGAIIIGFLKNLAGQIKSDTPVVIAVPAWLRPDGSYERLEILDRLRSSSEEKRSFSSETTQSGQLFPQEKVDLIDKLGYNVDKKTYEGLIYRRVGQIVARDIIILRKK